LLFKVGTRHDEAGVATVGKLVGFRQQILRLFALKEHARTALRHGQDQQWHGRQATRECPAQQ